MRTIICLAMLLLAQEGTVENWEYKGWSGFTPGSWIRFRSMQINEEGREEFGETTRTLKKVGDDEVTIELKTREPGDDEVETSEETVPARVESSKAPRFSGREEIEVDGKKLMCRTGEETAGDEGVTMTAKIWVCDEVPGGAVKGEMWANGQIWMRYVAVKWEKK